METNTYSPSKPSKWAIQEALVKYPILVDEPSLYDDEYTDFLGAVKTALFFCEWVEEKDEEFLLEKYGIRPGEVRSKLDISDWHHRAPSLRRPGPAW